ncbi:Sulfotransferase domain protein [Pseudoalteromonas sp. P1-26]|uniref:sulfotransferase family protein n=1 Tax=Pseudoalteromonas sp. P1-26 TaxID=1723759 RepID=UPI0006D66910|nr:sulfotransferase [Pseudoalteromonas sp. P1-26]KPZ67174.1 Sulfotransferase domain protein [Pseudoalteromonas sp. P1-26]
MELPNCIIIGAQKAGTTALFNYLVQHSKVSGSSPKELHFFDDENNYNKGLKWYSEKFSVENADIKIEATPFYLNHPKCAERIHDALGRIKLLVVLRDPVERAYSHYLHELKFGWETKSFSLALDHERVACNNILNFQHYSYKERGLYSKYLKVYYNTFGNSNVHCIDFEKLKHDPQSVLNGVCDFLGINRETFTLKQSSSEMNKAMYPKSSVLGHLCKFFDRALGHPNIFSRQIYKLNLTNIKKSKFDMGDSEKLNLINYFESDYRELKKITGMDFSWGKRYE